MDAKLLVLKRIFERLGISTEVGNVSDRKLKQKAVYLGQVMGLDLGYRYGWYLMGPYSPSLARDYYALADAAQNDDDRQLSADTLNKLSPVLALVTDENRPDDLEKGAWFELLASWHYLTHVSKKDQNSARIIMQSEKPYLSPYVDRAIERLNAIQH